MRINILTLHYQGSEYKEGIMDLGESAYTAAIKAGCKLSKLAWAKALGVDDIVAAYLTHEELIIPVLTLVENSKIEEIGDEN